MWFLATNNNLVKTMRIEALPINVPAEIAAGEVVERSASTAKEPVETTIGRHHPGHGEQRMTAASKALWLGVALFATTPLLFLAAELLYPGLYVRPPPTRLVMDYIILACIIVGLISLVCGAVMKVLNARRT